MKRYKYIYLIHLLTLIVFSSNIFGQTYSGNQTLNGKIKSIETFVYEILLTESSANDKMLWGTSIQKFNEDGHLISLEKSNIESASTSGESYIRDERGNPLEIIYDHDHPNMPRKQVMTYDQQDNVLTIKKYDVTSKLTTHVQRTYDEYNNVLTFKEYDENDNLNIHEQNIYVAENKVLYKLKIHGSGFVDTLLRNQYDSLLNLVQSKKYSTMGLLKSVEQFKYNEENVLIERQMKNIADSLWYSRLPQFRRLIVDSLKAGRNIDTFWYRKIDTSLISANYTYDRNGNIQEMKRFTNGIYQATMQFKYYSEGIMSEKSTVDANGTLTYCVKFNEHSQTIEILRSHGKNTTSSMKYDGQGNLKEIGHNLIRTLRYEYEYDEKGNWISRVTYNSEIPKLFTKRYITYY